MAVALINIIFGIIFSLRWFGKKILARLTFKGLIFKGPILKMRNFAGRPSGTPSSSSSEIHDRGIKMWSPNGRVPHKGNGKIDARPAPHPACG